MKGDLSASTVRIAATDGDQIEAYAATPMDDGPRGGVVVIHHLPGYDRGTKEIVRRFAEMGYDAVCPNLYWRQAPGSRPGRRGCHGARLRRDHGRPARRAMSAAPRRTCDRCRPAMERSASSATAPAGGRASSPRAGSTWTRPSTATAPTSPARRRRAGRSRSGRSTTTWPTCRCPLLGLFGKDDSYPSPEQVRELDELLRGYGKDFEHTSYDDTGHAFFSIDRPAYRVESAVDGWQRIEAFYGRHLS